MRTDKAVAVIRAQAQKKWDRRLGAVFGALSARELALVKAVAVREFQRGYSKGYYQTQPRDPVQARDAGDA